MLPSYISCFLLAVKVALGAIDPASGVNAVEKSSPPNEWDTYYWLPAELIDMRTFFVEIYDDFIDHSGIPEFKCKKNDAVFSRYYKSSKDPDHLLLSYFCRTKEVRGYEHFKVSQSKKSVLQFESSLKAFGIMDAGDYEEKLPYIEELPIEIVEDKDFKVLNNGMPVLATMDAPIKNTRYISPKEMKEAFKKTEAPTRHKTSCTPDWYYYCMNGAHCVYLLDEQTVACECAPNYGGKRCEKWMWYH